MTPGPDGAWDGGYFFVGVGLTFKANAQAIVLVKESGATQLVAFGFNSLAGCADRN